MRRWIVFFALMLVSYMSFAPPQWPPKKNAPWDFKPPPKRAFDAPINPEDCIPDEDGNVPEECIPVDGGLGFLIAAGLGFGGRMALKKKNTGHQQVI